LQYIDDYGWYPTNTLAPNEGAFIELAYAAKINLVGDVPPFPPFACRLVPSGFSIQSLPSYTENLDFLQPRDGDNIYLFDPVTQSYEDPCLYIMGFGWFRSTPPVGPEGPRIPSGTAFYFEAAWGQPECRYWCCPELIEPCGVVRSPSPAGLWLLSPSRTNTVFRFEFASELAERYEAQRTESLSGPWTTIQIVTGDGTTMQVEDRNAAAGKSHYRLVKLP